MSGKVLSGGCQCGAVRYTVDAPVDYTNHCHCSMCRRIHGALFGSYSRIAKARLSVECGADNLAVYRSSPPVSRSFCGTCGCPLFYEHDEAAKLIWFTTATLDGGAHPGHPREAEQHVCVDSKVPWHEITDGLPRRSGFTL